MGCAAGAGAAWICRRQARRPSSAAAVSDNTDRQAKSATVPSSERDMSGARAEQLLALQNNTCYYNEQHLGGRAAVMALELPCGAPPPAAEHSAYPSSRSRRETNLAKGIHSPPIHIEEWPGLPKCTIVPTIRCCWRHSLRGGDRKVVAAAGRLMGSPSPAFPRFAHLLP